MQFVYPAFLGALAVLAVPILIHLFYFRRFRKVYFTNVRFLKEVKEETNNARRLRNLLVLLARCLALAFLVLAFAQPFIPQGAEVKKGEKAVSVFVDNSFSMGTLSQNAPLLELAKQRARDIVQAFRPEDRFQVLSNDFEGRDQRLISKEDALVRIDEIQLSPTSRDLDKALIRQQQCLNTGKQENKIAFVISDYQQNVNTIRNFKDTLLDVYLVPMRAVQENNVSIDSVWFENPVQILNQPANLLVKVSNRSDEDAEEIRLTLTHDNQTKPVGALKIPARSNRIDTVSFNILHPGLHEAKISVSDYPVQFDDDYYITFSVAQQINLLAINGLTPNKYLGSAFAGAGYLKLDQADARALDYSRFPNYNLIILNEVSNISSGLAQELKTFADNGGNVLIFPAQNADPGSYNSLLGAFGSGAMGTYDPTPRQGGQLNTEEFVFSDVYLNKSANLRLPNTQGNFKLAPNSGEHIISYRDGSAMLAKFPQKSGALYLCAAPLNEQVNDMVRNAEIFVPMLFKMAVAGTKARQIAYFIGKDEVLEANHQQAASGEMVYKLRQFKPALQAAPGQAAQAGGDGAEFIPEQRILGAKVLLTPGTQVRDAGWYQLRLRSDSTLAEYAYNFDRKESDLSYTDEDKLTEGLSANFKVLATNAAASFTQVVDEQSRGIVLWRWCLIFALLFLALEVLFLRLWKV